MASAKKTLSIYRKRRTLEKSNEPFGTIHSSSGTSPIFVIQKHIASHIHYDIRLEIERVLVSWAVPKGPSIRPSIKRLALQTEDHPLEYADFEGIIPEGYGAGTVMIWDKGTYKNMKKKSGKLISMKQCLRDGHIEISLEGTKLKGAYTLIRMSSSIHGWLLIKQQDEYANVWQVPKNKRERSIITGRTMKQIACKK